MGPRVHPGLLDSLRYALGVARFIQVIWVHSGSPWGSLDSCWFVGFTRIRPGGRWVHLESFGSLAFALEVVGFIRVRPKDHWVDARSFGSLRFTLGVFQFIRGRWVHSGSPLG